MVGGFSLGNGWWVQFGWWSFMIQDICTWLYSICFIGYALKVGQNVLDKFQTRIK